MTPAFPSFNEKPPGPKFRREMLKFEIIVTEMVVLFLIIGDYYKYRSCDAFTIQIYNQYLHRQASIFRKHNLLFSHILAQTDFSQTTLNLSQQQREETLSS